MGFSGFCIGVNDKNPNVITGANSISPNRSLKKEKMDTARVPYIIIPSLSTGSDSFVCLTSINSSTKYYTPTTDSASKRAIRNLLIGKTPVYLSIKRVSQADPTVKHTGQTRLPIIEATLKPNL
ncbi:hypothetical protein A3H26_04145 [candidate division WWE3 bacterium RIFCSPLOWO2_12_FULL_36_10]|uniref:Uncharacterized protein n=1 Tax=candidate division WWE3 bacterium RIFCSPLOWO2_12_FULL_36_10 TaxID=1802630 RepID=A0A1F4VJ78_UNCKA|nr:MAG: hypothetical protein A3H26_04145 [candidate division WWE3 bacterium RIFCSPLOWO2_12_FULL_36_10]